MWLWLPEPNPENGWFGWDSGGQYGKSDLEMGAKGVSRVCIMAVGYVAVKEFP